MIHGRNFAESLSLVFLDIVLFVVGKVIWLVLVLDGEFICERRQARELEQKQHEVVQK